MPIQFLCPNCNKQSRAPDTYAGKLIRCKQCGQTMRIPSLDASPEAAPAASPEAAPAADAPVESFPEVEEIDAPIINLHSAPAKSKSGAMPTLNFTGGSPAVNVHVSGDAPIVNVASAAPKSSSGAMPVISAPIDSAGSSGMPQIAVAGSAGPAPTMSSAPMPAKPGAAAPTKTTTYFNVNKGTVSCLLLGVVLLGLGIYEGMSISGASDPPAKMSVSELVSKKSLPNRYVQIGGAYPWTEGKLHEGGEKTWTRVWLPFINPKDPGLNRGDKPKVLMVLKSKHVKSPADLAKWGKRTAFTGMVLDDSDLSTAERSKLMSAFPELRSARTIVLDEGEKPRSGIFMAIYLLGGVVFLLAGGYLMFLSPPIEGM